MGPTYDGVTPGSEDGAGDFDFASKPDFVWSLDVGDGYGIGTVDGNHYFHFDAAPNGAFAERLRCVDIESGEVVWSQTQPFVYRDMLGYEDGPRSSPTIEGDRIVTMGVTGLLTCRKRNDGELLWSVDTNRKYGVVQNFFGVGCSPMVLRNMVIVMVGGSPPADQDIAPMRLDRVSPNGSAVVAFDLQTGKEIWKCGEDLASYSSPRPMQVDGKTLVLAFARDGLLAIDAEQGLVRWRVDHRADILESVNAMMPVIDDDYVFISECYQVGSLLLRVDAKSSTVVWRDPPRDRRNQSMRCHWSTPILVDGYLYGCSGRNAPDSDFRCIELKTGKVQWIDPRRVRSSVTRVGQSLVVLDERGGIQFVRSDPGKFDLISEWDLSQSDGQRPALDYPCWAAPIVVGDKLFVRGTQRVLCLRLKASG